MCQQPHLHVTSGDEALVLDVTRLEELVGLLQDGVLSHVSILACARLFSASLPLPRSPGRRGGRSTGGGTRRGESCHGACEPVNRRALPCVLHMSQVRADARRKEIPEKSSFRMLYHRGSRQCHRLSSLSNHLFNKSMKPRREAGGESSVLISTAPCPMKIVTNIIPNVCTASKTCYCRKLKSIKGSSV